MLQVIRRFGFDFYVISLHWFICRFTAVFFFTLSVRQAGDRLVQLERKVRAIDQEKTLETTEGTLTSLRRYLNHPNSAFDRFEVLDLLQALVHLALT